MICIWFYSLNNSSGNMFIRIGRTECDDLRRRIFRTDPAWLYGTYAASTWNVKGRKAAMDKYVATSGDVVIFGLYHLKALSSNHPKIKAVCQTMSSLARKPKPTISMIAGCGRTKHALLYFAQQYWTTSWLLTTFFCEISSRCGIVYFCLTEKRQKRQQNTEHKAVSFWWIVFHGSYLHYTHPLLQNRMLLDRSRQPECHWHLYRIGQQVSQQCLRVQKHQKTLSVPAEVCTTTSNSHKLLIIGIVLISVLVEVCIGKGI